MNHPQPNDEPFGRPPGRGCLILAAGGGVSVFALIVIMAMVRAIFFPASAKLGSRGWSHHPAVGQTLPELRLEPLVGAEEPVTLDDLAGKVVLVNFWGTWCQPCWYEIPFIAALGKKLQDRPDFKLLAVSCPNQMPQDVDTLRRETAGFLRQFKLDMPTYADPDGITWKAFASLGGLGGLPSTLLIDREGIIRGVWVGYSEDVPGQVEQSVFQLLDEQE